MAYNSLTFFLWHETRQWGSLPTCRHHQPRLLSPVLLRALFRSLTHSSLQLAWSFLDGSLTETHQGCVSGVSLFLALTAQGWPDSYSVEIPLLDYTALTHTHLELWGFKNEQIPMKYTFFFFLFFFSKSHISCPPETSTEME